MERRHVCENNMKKEGKGMVTALWHQKGLVILHLPWLVPLATSHTQMQQMQCNIENEEMNIAYLINK
jgi:hypothetical protein